MRAMTRRGFVLGGAAALAAVRGRAQTAGGPVEAATSGPDHHFAGYFDRCPWDAGGRYLLVHRAAFAGRQPVAGETAAVGCIDSAAGGVFRPLGATAAWCWQLGALPGWLPGAPEREVIYNVRDGERWASVRVDVPTGRRRLLPFPVYHLHPDGTRALSLSFSRLAWTRPGYGFEGILDPRRHVAAPEDDGVYVGDLERGGCRLVVPLARVAMFRPLPEFAESYHWVNHLLWSPDGARFVFLHRWCRAGQPRRTRLYTADGDGGNLRLLLDHQLVSHFVWRDARTLLAWAQHPSAGTCFYLVDERTGAVAPFHKDVLVEDGHASFSPDGAWVVCDTYPDQRGMRHLFLVRVRDGARVELARLRSPEGWHQAARCDLHPRWSRDGARICIDSAHEKTRQVYVIDVARHVKEP
ncbi:MAG TPA: hypothetical protein DCM87_05835 [Planctomycetes bacterium]|nr:hypothetical protein [Planctomycetota bacterium]